MFVNVRVNRASRDVAGSRTGALFTTDARISTITSLAFLIMIMMDSAIVSAEDASRRQRRPGTNNVPIIMANSLN